MTLRKMVVVRAPSTTNCPMVRIANRTLQLHGFVIGAALEVVYEQNIITLKILEIVGGAAVNTIDLIDAILSSGYGASYGKMQYEFSKRQSDREIKSFRKKICLTAKLKE